LIKLEEHIRRDVPDCVALCIDPWKNLAEDINDPRFVNRALTALSGLAVRLDLYVVLVAHFNASGTVAGYRGLQQQARSRVEFRKIESSTNDVTRVAVLHEKTNVTAKAHGLTYEWRSPGEGLGWHTGHNPLHWTGTTTVTSEYLLREKPRSKIQIAEDWLRSLLADGPLPGADVKELAQEEGIAEKTLRRARQNVCDTSHAGPGSTWGLK
jgi:hypothetical protein